MRKVLEIINKMKKEGISITYFPKTAHWTPLSPNSESVDKTTNTSFKNPRAPSVAENEADFGLI